MKILDSFEDIVLEDSSDSGDLADILEEFVCLIVWNKLSKENGEQKQSFTGDKLESSLSDSDLLAVLDDSDNVIADDGGYLQQASDTRVKSPCALVVGILISLSSVLVVARQVLDELPVFPIGCIDLVQSGYSTDPSAI